MHRIHEYRRNKANSGSRAADHAGAVAIAELRKTIQSELSAALFQVVEEMREQ
jgi:hypothetical protein